MDMYGRLIPIAAFACSVLVVFDATADERSIPVQSVEAPRPEAHRDGPSAENLAAWVQALASDVYAERKAATQQLLAAGPAAVAPVAAAADAADLEIPGRCLRILKRLAKSSDPATKQASARALQELARSPHSYVSRQAAAALIEPPPPITQARIRFGRVGGPFGAQRIGVPVQPARLERSLVRELTVEDNGRGISFRYETGARRELRIRVAETVEGQEKTTEFKAESAIALRKQSPAAADLYDKYVHDLVRQPVQIIAGNQVVPVRVPAHAAVRIRVQTRNTGERSIHVEDNGREVEITDKNGRDIVIRITKVGRPEAAEYQARDLDELKEQHPAEVAELYEKYASGQRGFRVITGPRRVQIEAVPLRPTVPDAVPADAAPAAEPATAPE